MTLFQKIKNRLSTKQFSVILNIVLIGVVLAGLIIFTGQPQHQEFDEEKAEAAAEKTVEQHEHGNDAPEAKGGVVMTDRQIKLNGIEILVAGPASIRSSLHLLGEVHVNADKSVIIVPRLPGIVESVSVNAGDKVKRGQVLASISSQAIAEQRSELLSAEARVDLARTTFEREKRLWEEKVSAEQDYLQARQALQEAQIALQQARQKLQAIGAKPSGSNIARYNIISPIDGVVTTKQIAVGQVLTGTETLYIVSDLSTVWAEASIYAKDINTVKVGQQVLVKTSAFEAQAAGTITYVGALVGEESRTAMARVVLPNPERMWLPGLPITVELHTDEVEVPLAVSVEGLQELEGQTVVFLRKQESFQTRHVKLGRRDEHYAEVIEGLSPGESYAAENSYLVKAELGKSHAEHEH